MCWEPAEPAGVQARTITGLGSQMQPTAWRNLGRELFLVSPRGTSVPSFVISLDTVRATPMARRVRSTTRSTRHLYEGTLDEESGRQPPRPVRRPLRPVPGPTEVTQTAYQEPMEHLKAQHGQAGQ